jgi:alkylation response protein AidB-like acyl-CoA dehydrogenase
MDFSRVDQSPETIEFIALTRERIGSSLRADYAARERVRRDEHDPDFFRAAGSFGWLAPQWPTEKGGAGYDELQAVILELELLRADAPSANIVTTQMVLPSVDELGSEELRDEVVARIATGETGISLGYTEAESGSDIATVKTRAERDGTDWLISGTKLYTTGAHHCGYCFLLTRTNPDAPNHRGLTMFLVPMALDGIGVSPIWTLGERTNTVTFDQVRVADRYRIGAADGGWRVLLGPLSIEHGLESRPGPSLGDIGRRHARRLSQCLDATLAWSQDERRGSFSTEPREVRRRLAGTSVRLEAAIAAWGRRGRVAAVEALVDGTADLFDLLGADGVLAEAGTPVEFVERWVRQSQIAPIYGGTVEIFRNMLAQDLGLPRQEYHAAVGR